MDIAKGSLSFIAIRSLHIGEKILQPAVFFRSPAVFRALAYPFIDNLPLLNRQFAGEVVGKKPFNRIIRFHTL